MKPSEYFEYFFSQLKDLPDWLQRYFKIHRVRYIKILEEIPYAKLSNMKALDVGTYGFPLCALRTVFGYQVVNGIVFEPCNPYKIFTKTFPFDPDNYNYQIFNLNIEKECLPLGEPTYDFIIASEIIEHLTTDPMAFLVELNRVLKFGGTLLITTPNIASLESTYNILKRQHPQIYYVYRKHLSTDRHNFEYTPDLIKILLEVAGFEVIKLKTEYIASQEREDILKILKDNGFPTDLRGDTIFVQAVKVSYLKERFPEFLYE